MNFFFFMIKTNYLLLFLKIKYINNYFHLNLIFKLKIKKKIFYYLY